MPTSKPAKAEVTEEMRALAHRITYEFVGKSMKEGEQLTTQLLADFLQAHTAAKANEYAELQISRDRVMELNRCQGLQIADLRARLSAREEEVKRSVDNIATLRAELVALQKTNRLACEDWADDHTKMQEKAVAVGIPKEATEGDSYGVPGIQELADLIIEHMRAELAACRLANQRQIRDGNAGNIPPT